MFDTDEKTLLKESLVKYVSYLQKRFFKDKNISEEDYHQQMNHIESIVGKIHLNDLYKL
ncbi:hypothetical protein [Synechococcus phage metaG-MbCM1]|uniref:Uncharacterized protein n=1 Tax=Synechococcus phage metaG-MbCM1 TaxID=1079999 RepID=H8ZN30_9CAUD|nr:hypothetical protein [Synechococcus phage metaG-MbCM1]AFD02891.1 hypothetical protein [Synechococcus phage metaG-MbCM1]